MVRYSAGKHHACRSALHEDETVGLSEVLSGLIGNAADAYKTRADRLYSAVEDYQRTLLKYRDAVRAKAGDATRDAARESVKRAFADMQRHFRRELAIQIGRARTAFATRIVTATTGVAKCSWSHPAS